jgi:glycosyltransferase involved in cell wall biosynthesis
VKIAAFTGGLTVPSARFRVRQYVSPLLDYGISLNEVSLATGAYPPAGRISRPLWGIRRLAELGLAIAKTRSADATLLQREMISSFKTLEGLTKGPRILDVDDAVHLQRDGNFARKIASVCDRVIAGNDYLANHYVQFCRDVVVMPTGVDSAIYVPGAKDPNAQQLIVGWIGTSANFPYLRQIESALAQFLAKTPDAHLLIISNISPAFEQIDPTRWSFRQWSEAREVSDIQSMDIGIMPLADSEWARGKCSFKMLQYMSCGLPVIVSPVGMNAQVLVQGNLGLAASSDDDWIDALDLLAQSSSIRNVMGVVGRKIVEAHFAVQTLTPQLAKHLSCS